MLLFTVVICLNESWKCYNTTVALNEEEPPPYENNGI